MKNLTVCLQCVGVSRRSVDLGTLKKIKATSNRHVINRQPAAESSKHPRNCSLLSLKMLAIKTELMELRMIMGNEGRMAMKIMVFQIVDGGKQYFDLNSDRMVVVLCYREHVKSYILTFLRTSKDFTLPNDSALLPNRASPCGHFVTNLSLKTLFRFVHLKVGPGVRKTEMSPSSDFRA